MIPVDMPPLEVSPLTDPSTSDANKLTATLSADDVDSDDDETSSPDSEVWYLFYTCASLMRFSLNIQCYSCLCAPSAVIYVLLVSRMMQLT